MLWRRGRPFIIKAIKKAEGMCLARLSPFFICFCMPFSMMFQFRTPGQMLRAAFLLLVLAWLHAPVWAATVLRVGVYDNPPKVFLDGSGRASGSFIDILREIALVHDWELQFQRCEWQHCLEMLEGGELDLMPDVARTDERARRFDFHQKAALHSWSQLYRRPGIRVESVLDLQGKRVAVLSSGVQQEALANMLRGFNVQFELVAAKTVVQAFEMAANGQADVAAASYHFGDFKAPSYGLEATSVLFQPAQLFFAATKGQHQPELALIDRQLEQWLADDSSPYFEVLRRWGVKHSEPPVAGWLVAALAGVAGFALLLAGGVFWLRRRVRGAVRELSATNRQLQATLKAVPDLMFELDARGTYLAVQATQEELLAAPMAGLVGRNIDDVLPEAAAAVVHAVIHKALELGHAAGEIIVLDLPGGQHWFEMSAARKEVAERQVPSVILLSRDVTQRVKDRARIEHLADFDHLTGLPNRMQLHRLFDKTIGRAQRNGSKMAVIFMDIDHFKHVNDSLGHAVGDKLLQDVANRLVLGLRDSDIASRLGGDEFVLVLDDTDADGASRLAMRLREDMHAAFSLGPYETRISMSMGIAMFPEDGADMETLLRNADTALYKAKEEGRNDIRFFTTTMQVRAERFLVLSSALDKALELGQIDAHFQPLQDLRTEKIIGAEALMRWSHPELGSISPAEFIPLAESTGQIFPLGEWMLLRACTQAKTWLDGGRGLLVAVNVSALQFRQPDFVAMVERQLQASQLPPHLLELEVTESLTMGDPKAAIAKMQQLRTLGVRVSIDDFGTGYSSMSYLSRLGFHKLKIDQSFVRQIGRDKDDEAIISAIIQLAHSLGMDSLAEGVETQAQRDFLRGKGCGYIQGWFLGRAMPVAELDALLAAHARH